MITVYIRGCDGTSDPPFGKETHGSSDGLSARWSTFRAATPLLSPRIATASTLVKSMPISGKVEWRPEPYSFLSRGLLSGDVVFNLGWEHIFLPDGVALPDVL